MIRVFIDANVIFAASVSLSGGSAYIFDLAKKRKLKLFSSRLAIKEAERNLNEKGKESDIIRLYDLLSETNISLLDAHRVKAKEKYSSLVGEKDAPILSSAIASKAEFLLTLDKKHLLNIRVLDAGLPIKIGTPGEFIEKYL